MPQFNKEERMAGLFRASVVIPTFNRKGILRECLKSIFRQTISLEVIVLDDGSTDGTEAMLAQEFPMVRYRRLKGPNGPCLLRNMGVEMATSPIVLSFDDDSILISPYTAEQTLSEFDNPRVASVGIPYINVRIEQTVRQQAPAKKGVYVAHAFVGASHAVRRDTFLHIGGFKPELFYMGEEGDLCLRLLEIGYVCRVGGADALHHLESPLRVHERAAFYGRRNDVLLAWYNTPLERLLWRLVKTSVGGLIHGSRSGLFWHHLKGLMFGYVSIISHFNNRKPVSYKIYRLYRDLRRQGCILLDEIEGRLPELNSL